MDYGCAMPIGYANLNPGLIIIIRGHFSDITTGVWQHFYRKMNNIQVSRQANLSTENA